MKLCSKCKISKDLNSFHNCSTSKDGLKSSCKECRNSDSVIRRKSEKFKIKDREYRENNKERLKEYKKEYYENNKEEILKNSKKYYNDNKDYINNRNSIYSINNKENISKYQKEYYLNNKEILNEYKKDWFGEKYKSDNVFRLKNNISSLIRSSLKKNGFKKKSKSVDILGCDIEKLKIYLESKFEDWMSWDNYGKYDGSPKSGWDIDHKIPLSSGITEEDMINLNHYTNLQPLCGYINRNIKKDKIYYEMD